MPLPRKAAYKVLRVGDIPTIRFFHQQVACLTTKADMIMNLFGCVASEFRGGSNVTDGFFWAWSKIHLMSRIWRSMGTFYAVSRLYSSGSVFMIRRSVSRKMCGLSLLLCRHSSSSR